MRVSDLIPVLQLCDPHYKVLVERYNSTGADDIEDVDIQKVIINDDLKTIVIILE